jgi:peptide-methionine (S)-S-oxide reductase
MNNKTQIATLAGGCFWCLEAVFDELAGVSQVDSGYAGGHVDSPTYSQVCTGSTGHAEVVQIKFNPEEISFDDLLRVFFAIHNPTTLNRQGNDIGTQYRSAIFYHTPEQKATAEKIIRELTESSLWDAPIVTEVEPIDKFFIAEDYHQEYFANNPNQPYCQAVVRPKVAKFRQKFIKQLKK